MPTSLDNNTPLSSTADSSPSSPSMDPAPTPMDKKYADSQQEAISGEREHEPLLESPIPGDDVDGSVLDGDPMGEEEKSKSTWFLMCLTIGIGGLQIAWSVELSSVTPFLLSIGISKALMALVWIAGPLAGALVQPYIGIRSDNCRIRWGRRRPFMIGGAIATGICLLLLSWSREIVHGFLGLFGASPAGKFVTVSTQIYAVVLVYLLDFAINVIQAALRAFIVDCAPTHQQDVANAWAIRFTGVGSIVGYLSGYIDLPTIFPWLGHSEFQILSAIACFAMAFTLAISCALVSERDPRLDGPPNTSAGVLAFFINLYHSVRRLPPQIKIVCYVQLWAWVGWFPVLFYTSTYIGGVYAEPYFRDNPNMTPAEVDAVWEAGTRVGSYGLLVFAITTFVASMLLPLLITPTISTPTTTTPSPSTDKTGFTLSSLRIPGFTLRRLWLLSHLMFTFLMWCTFLIHNVPSALTLIGFVGIPWAVTNWVPFALIAAEISRREDTNRRSRTHPSSSHSISLTEDNPDGKTDQAGVVLGIHNVSIAAPQIIATLVSSLIFKALQRPRGAPGDASIDWVLRFGGLCALGAAWVCRYVGDEDGGQKRERGSEGRV